MNGLSGNSVSRVLGLAIVLAAAAAVSCGGGGSDQLAPPEFTVTVVMAGSGSGQVVDDLGAIHCPTSCGPEAYSEDIHVLLTATPNEGSSFAGWSGDCTPVTDHPEWCELLVTGQMEITATFNSP